MYINFAIKNKTKEIYIILNREARNEKFNTKMIFFCDLDGNEFVLSQREFHIRFTCIYNKDIKYIEE